MFIYSESLSHLQNIDTKREKENIFAIIMYFKRWSFVFVTDTKAKKKQTDLIIN